MSQKSSPEFKPYASRIAQVLTDMGYERFNDTKKRAGYRVTGWVHDEYSNPTARIEWLGTRREMGNGRFSEASVQEFHRNKLKELREKLTEYGYSIEWGWDPDDGERDTTFIVVVSKESAAADVEEEFEAAEESPEEVDEEAEMSRLATMTISNAEATEAALAIARAYNVGRDEVARRLEHRLMTSVLTAIVYGTDEAVDLAAAALSTQHLPFAR
jgi:hypothetical protein